MWWKIGNREREMKSQAGAQHTFRQQSNAAALKQEMQHLVPLCKTFEITRIIWKKKNKT